MCVCDQGAKGAKTAKAAKKASAGGSGDDIYIDTEEGADGKGPEAKGSGRGAKAGAKVAQAWSKEEDYFQTLRKSHLNQGVRCIDYCVEV